LPAFILFFDFYFEKKRNFRENPKLGYDSFPPQRCKEKEE